MNLRDERLKLCDLLQGRVFRLHAEGMIVAAIDIERRWTCVDVTGQIERAAHFEWIALITERGQVAWGGGRFNRCGSPEAP